MKKQQPERPEIFDALKNQANYLALRSIMRANVKEAFGDVPKFFIIVAIAMKEQEAAVKADKLAEILDLDPRLVINAIQGGVERGLIEEEPGEDGPAFKLTPAALDTLDSLKSKVANLLETPKELLTKEEVAAVKSAVAKMTKFYTENLPEEKERFIQNTINKKPKCHRGPGRCGDFPPEHPKPRFNPARFDFDDEFEPEDFIFDPKELGFEIDPVAARTLLTKYVAAKLIRHAQKTENERLAAAIRFALAQKHADWYLDDAPCAADLTPAQVKALVKLFRAKMEAKKVLLAEELKKYSFRGAFEEDRPF